MRLTIILGLLGISGQAAAAAELFTAATGNLAGRIEDSDYGTPEGTGGTIVALGGVWSGPANVRLPFEARLQRSHQKTAWNDNREPGTPHYRDGYTIESEEFLLGSRWSFPGANISTSLLMGVGRSTIIYQTRENLKGKPAVDGDSRALRHLTGQWDVRLQLPFTGDRWAVELLTMLRLTRLGRHKPDPNVAPATWHMNIPTLPMPSVGLAVGTSI
jgi:hypothetical protein